MNRHFHKSFAFSLIAFLTTPVVFAKAVTHDELQQITKTCFQKFNETIWLQATGVIADADNTFRFDMENSPGPYSTDATVLGVAMKTSESSLSLLKKGATAWNRACKQTLTSSIKQFQFTIDCSDTGSNIPTKRVRKLTLKSAEPAGLPELSYQKADIELTYDDMGSRTPELDLIHKVKLTKPQEMSDKVLMINGDTQQKTSFAVNTTALYQCLAEPLKDIHSFE